MASPVKLPAGGAAAAWICREATPWSEERTERWRKRNRRSQKLTTVFILDDNDNPGVVTAGFRQLAGVRGYC